MVVCCDIINTWQVLQLASIHTRWAERNIHNKHQAEWFIWAVVTTATSPCPNPPCCFVSESLISTEIQLSSLLIPCCISQGLVSFYVTQHTVSPRKLAYLNSMWHLFGFFFVNSAACFITVLDLKLSPSSNQIWSTLVSVCWIVSWGWPLASHVYVCVHYGTVHKVYTHVCLWGLEKTIGLSECSTPLKRFPTSCTTTFIFKKNPTFFVFLYNSFAKINSSITPVVFCLKSTETFHFLTPTVERN